MMWPRLLIALPLLAAPIWAGAAGRSYWLAPVLIVVFALAYIDGKNRIWREAFIDSGALEKTKAVLGAAAAQTILVGLLFFAATGVASVFGALGERAAFDRLDAGVASAVLALCLLGGALVRWAEGGRDPVDRALDNLSEALREIDEGDLDEAVDDAFAGRLSPFDALEAELDGLAQRFLVAETEIDSLARRMAEADAPLSAASHLTHLARNPDPDSDARVGAANRLKAVYRAMRRLWEADSHEIEDIYAASFEALILSTLKGGDDAALRLEAVTLAEAMGLRGDRLAAALQAIERESGLEEESGKALKSRAARLLERLEAP